MAGKLLSLEEAADHLGVTPDRVRQLVDKRQLSALRDTAGPKFRVEELNRYLADAADDVADSQSIATPAVTVEQSDAPSETVTDSIEVAEEPAAADSGLSLDGLDLELGEPSDVGIEIHEPDRPSPSDKTGHPVETSIEKQAVPSTEDEPAIESGLQLDDLEFDSGISLADDEPALSGPADEASLVLDDDSNAIPAEGPQTIVGGAESLIIGDEEAGDGQQNTNADAASLVAGDDIELSGLDMSLSGNLSGLDLENASEAAPKRQPAEAAEQSLVVGDSLSGDLDLESLVASGNLDAGDADGGASFAGSDLLSDISVADPSGTEKSGNLLDSDSGASDVGSQLSGSGVIMEGGIDLQGDDVKPWDVDLGEFMNDVEEDADAPTMLGGGEEFDLDADATAEDPSQSADLASESQVGGDSSFFDKSQGPADSGFFGQSAGLEGGGLGGPTPLSEMGSSSQFGVGLETKFTKLQVFGLICCSLLLLVGGLLTFDLVRTIGSPADTPLANPLAGGLAKLVGW